MVLRSFSEYFRLECLRGVINKEINNYNVLCATAYQKLIVYNIFTNLMESNTIFSVFPDLFVRSVLRYMII